MNLGTYLPLAVGVGVALLALLGWALVAAGATGSERQTELFDARKDYPS